MLQRNKWWPGVVHEGRAVAIVYPDFSKACSTASYKVLTEKMRKYKLD